MATTAPKGKRLLNVSGAQNGLPVEVGTTTRIVRSTEYGVLGTW